MKKSYITSGPDCINAKIDLGFSYGNTPEDIVSLGTVHFLIFPHTTNIAGTH